jgi:hypothetical protein
MYQSFPLMSGLFLLTLTSVAGLIGCHPSRDYCNDVGFCSGCPRDTPMRCRFDGIEVTSMSCASACHARVELFEALCDARSTATRAEIEEAAVCEEVAEQE